MNKKRLLTVMGGNGLQRISLDFSAYADGALPLLIGSTWSVSGGKAINTPTEGSELFTNGNMETGDPPDGWLSTNSPTLSQEADERTGGAGSNSLQAISGASVPRIYQTTNLPVHSWVKEKLWSKSIDTAVCAFYGSNVDRSLSIPNNTSWGNYSGLLVTTSALNYVGFGVIGGVGATGRFDDVSAKTLTGLFAGVKLNNTLLTAKISITLDSILFQNQGVFICGDSESPSSYVMARMYKSSLGATDYLKIILEKYINGARTEIISSASTAYSAGAYLEIRRTDSTTFQLWYNDAQVGADQTISDAGLINNKYVGMFSDGGSGSTIDAFFCS